MSQVSRFSQTILNKYPELALTKGVVVLTSPTGGVYAAYLFDNEDDKDSLYHLLVHLSEEYFGINNYYIKLFNMVSKNNPFFMYGLIKTFGHPIVSIVEQE